MALKVSNKNRKKNTVNDQITDAVTASRVNAEHAEFTKKFTKYYAITFVVLAVLFFII